MLLAAGAGTRLRPLTDTVPKPLAPIANVPLIERTLGWLRDQGVDQAVVNLHHHADQIRETVGSGERHGIDVRYSVEEKLLGTSGAVKRCAEYFQDEPFFVIYGDNLIDADLQKLYAYHQSTEADATIALFQPDDRSASGMVEMEAGGRVTRFVEKPRRGETAATMANAGVYVLNPALLNALPEGVSDFGKDIFPAWIAENRAVYATELGGYLQDTGTPERYKKANWDVLAGGMRYTPHGLRNGDNLVAEGVIVDHGADLAGRNIIGAGCVIGAGARLTECILWPGAAIQSGAALRNVIVGCDALVPVGFYAQDTILV